MLIILVDFFQLLNKDHQPQIRTYLAVSHDADVVPVHAGRHDGIRVLKDIHLRRRRSIHTVKLKYFAVLRVLRVGDADLHWRTHAFGIWESQSAGDTIVLTYTAEDTNIPCNHKLTIDMSGGHQVWTRNWHTG